MSNQIIQNSIVEVQIKGEYHSFRHDSGNDQDSDEKATNFLNKILKDGYRNEVDGSVYIYFPAHKIDRIVHILCKI